jgi:N-acyl-phosphatidylethanolamine-hydrolysing phospholipase D
MLLACAGCTAVGAPKPDAPAHHRAYGFANPSGLKGTSPAEFVIDRTRLAVAAREETPVAALPRDTAQARWLGSAPHDVVQWLGHAGVRLRLEGHVLAVDPVFARVLSPLPPIGPRRATPPPAHPADLRDVGTVLLTHDHYDHFDARLVRRLGAQGSQCLVPLGVENRRLGRCDAVAMDWRQSVEVAGLRVTYLPAQHESGRGLFDRDQTLWGGWMIEGGGKRVYISGDTGYGPHFREARRRGKIDFAVLNLGGYRPREQNRYVHMTPEEAVRALRDLGTPRALIVHWGTYGLGLETGQETYDRTRAAAKAAGLAPDRVVFKQIGDITRM